MNLLNPGLEPEQVLQKAIETLSQVAVPTGMVILINTSVSGAPAVVDFSYGDPMVNLGLCENQCSKIKEIMAMHRKKSE